MWDWSGAWGKLPGSDVRHAAIYDRDHDEWRSWCMGGKRRPLVYVGHRYPPAQDDEHGLTELRPCQLCMERLRWATCWWMDQFRYVREDAGQATAS